MRYFKTKNKCLLILIMVVVSILSKRIFLHMFLTWLSFQSFFIFLPWIIAKLRACFFILTFPCSFPNYFHCLFVSLGIIPNLRAWFSILTFSWLFPNYSGCFFVSLGTLPNLRAWFFILTFPCSFSNYSGCFFVSLGTLPNLRAYPLWSSFFILF